MKHNELQDLHTKIAPAIRASLSEFHEVLKIPLEHMDMVLWYRVKEEVFK